MEVVIGQVIAMYEKLRRKASSFQRFNNSNDTVASYDRPDHI